MGFVFGFFGWVLLMSVIVVVGLFDLVVDWFFVGADI